MSRCENDSLNVPESVKMRDYFWYISVGSIIASLIGYLIFSIKTVVYFLKGTEFNFM